MLVDYGKGALPTLEFSDLELERAETSEGPGGAVEEVAGPDANVEVARADVAVVELEGRRLGRGRTSSVEAAESLDLRRDRI
jgi:hypothetical protein